MEGHAKIEVVVIINENYYRKNLNTHLLYIELSFLHFYMASTVEPAKCDVTEIINMRIT